MYYYVLNVTNVVAMKIMYMVILKQIAKILKKRNTPLRFLQYSQQIDIFGMYVLIYNPSLQNCHYTQYLANMVGIATRYRVNFMAKMRKNVSPSFISTILTTESQIWYVFLGFHLFFSCLYILLITDHRQNVKVKCGM